MVSIIIVVVVMACAGWMAWSRWTYWRTPIRPQPAAEMSPQSRRVRGLYAREYLFSGGAVGRRDRRL